MKRMSEVFELPVSVLDIGYGIHTIDDAEIYAAHAINNVDALADALEKLIPYWFGGNEKSLDAMVAAQDALAAYRGSK